jgi:hypothetical protein
MPPKIAAIFALAAVGCVFLSTIFGVSYVSDWLIDAAEVFFAVAVLVFGSYVILGIIGDAGTV